MWGGLGPSPPWRDEWGHVDRDRIRLDLFPPAFGARARSRATSIRARLIAWADAQVTAHSELQEVVVAACVYASRSRLMMKGGSQSLQRLMHLPALAVLGGVARGAIWQRVAHFAGALLGRRLRDLRELSDVLKEACDEDECTSDNRDVNSDNCDG